MSIQEYAKLIASQAPPLTAEQADALTNLFTTARIGDKAKA